MSQTIQRFVGLDVHKNYVVVGAVDTRQEVAIHPRRVSLIRLDGWAKKYLKPTDTVVLEATSNAWHIHDLLEPLVARVVVANPYLVKLIAASFVKTDKRDALALARLLAANIIPEVWVPPHHVRELRALISHRRRLVSQRTAAKNRLWSVLMRHNIVPPAGQIFSTAQRDWWEHLSISSSEELRTQHDLAVIDHLSPLIEEVEAELARLSVCEHWAQCVAFLVQLPGIGLLTAMTLLGGIGDITRFASAKKLVGYSGLGSRVYDSGQTHRTGRITKQGRRELRSVMIEAAWVAVRRHPFWQAKFERLAERIGKQTAIVAIARKLLVVVWHVLTAQVADRQADPQAVARNLMTWATRYGLATSLGIPRALFVRRELDRLGIGQTMHRFKYNGQYYRFPLTMPATVTEEKAAVDG
jgi:transposase